MGNLVGFTVISLRHLSQAINLGTGFLRHHPSARFVVAIIDHPMDVLLCDDKEIEFVRACDIPSLQHEFFQLAVALDEKRLIEYVRPRVAEYLSTFAASVLCFDYSVEVFGELTDLTEIENDVDVVLVPRRLTAHPLDGLNPTRDYVFDDFFDSGVFAINSLRDDFIRWWLNVSELSIDYSSKPEMYFLSEATVLFNARVLRDPRYGIAFWNLDERRIGWNDEQWCTGQQALLTCFFKGYIPDRPYWISDLIEGKSRHFLTGSETFSDLYIEYSKKIAVQTNSITPRIDWYGWDSFLPGYKLTSGVRHVYRTEWLENQGRAENPPTPFLKESFDNFIQWMEGTSEIKGPSLQRFNLGIFIDRPDIHGQFVHGQAVDYEAFGHWIQSFGRYETPMVRVLKYSPPLRNEVKDVGRSRNGVDVIGSLNSEHGLGEAGRLLVEALKSTDEQVSTICYSPVGVRGKHPFNADNVSQNRLTVVALNPEQTKDLWKMYDRRFRNGRYVIGQWFWELEIAPPWYKTAFSERLIDELWAPTRFIEEMLNTCTPSNIPVHYMPLPFDCPTIDPTFSLKSIGLDEKFTFLFTFDFGSVVKRKNPHAVIRAFKLAFKENQGPQLIIKSINGKVRQKQYEELKWLCEGRKDIFLIDEYFDNDKNAALIASANCYVSLHRSEGLGLTLAEAMLLEKPVIATGYSGNLDFMNDETGFLVPWRYTKVGDDAGGYPSYAQWAEPDVSVAAELMRYVVDNPSASREVGIKAREYIEKEFSPAVTGLNMSSRLKELRK